MEAIRVQTTHSQQGVTAQNALTVGVVGLGVGEQHARAFAAAGCRLRWLYDLDAERAFSKQHDLGAQGCAADFETLLTDSSVAAIAIASYDDAHFEQLIPALHAGKHVFVEKPLCRSTQELDRVQSAWQAGGRPHLQSNLVLRAAPVYRWLRDAIRTGRLGRIYALDGDYLFGRLHKITQEWRKDVPDYSVMQGGGVHMIDLMIWLTGERPQSVNAAGNRICTEGTAFRYLDFMAATYVFPSGMIGRISANFGCVHRHQHVLRVFGTEATFILDDQGPRLHSTRDPQAPVEKLSIPTLPAHKGDLIPAFVRGICEGADPGPAAQHEFDLIAACIAADQAVKSQTTVEIQYP